MKTVKNLCLAILVLFSAACSSNDDKMGDWEKTESFGGKPRSGSVSFTIGDRIYVGSGIDADNYELNDFWSFDGGQWREMASLPVEAARFGAVAFSDGKYGYVGLGYAKKKNSDVSVDPEWFKDFYKYDPAANSWTKIADFPGAVRRFAVGFSINGIGYVGTGYGEGKTGVYKDYFSYNPATNTWDSSLGGFGEPREGATAFVIGGTAYICLGTEGNSPVRDVIKFTPADAQPFSLAEPLKDKDGQSFDDDYNKIPRYYAVSFVVKNKEGLDRAYVATGTNGSLLRTCWEFRPEKDRWEEMTEFPQSRMQGVAFTLNNIGYVTLGGTSVAENTAKYRDTFRFFPELEDDDQNDD